MGIGTAFTRDMLEFLKNKGYKQTPLSAQKTNYAVRMYRKQVLRLLMKMKKNNYPRRKWLIHMQPKQIFLK